MNSDLPTTKPFRTPKIGISSDADTNLSFKRSLQVEAVGIVKIVPDLCHVLIRITSQKVSVKLKQKCFNQWRLAIPIPLRYLSPALMLLNCMSFLKILTQKLDDTVTLTPITFSISSKSLAQGRLQSAGNAVQNARKKATEMARLVEGSLGAPLSIEQIGCEENNLSAFSDSWPNSQFNNWQQACMVVKSSVMILFELKPRKIS
ncbi:IRAK1BP1 [Bugula neritina]|uniref:IRAK1BP1 n=1 Tax=Bugula neritina TaxID=10212 RepID=A0A7J7KNE0_BUGNE|nr:IRAK1BP1 [Bugula neritina]